MLLQVGIHKKCKKILVVLTQVSKASSRKKEVELFLLFFVCFHYGSFDRLFYFWLEWLTSLTVKIFLLGVILSFVVLKIVLYLRFFLNLLGLFFNLVFEWAFCRSWIIRTLLHVTWWYRLNIWNLWVFIFVSDFERRNSLSKLFMNFLRVFINIINSYNLFLDRVLKICF